MNWLQRFMAGRYGVDPMTFGILVLYFIILFAGNIANWPWLGLLALVLVVWAFFRMLSRNLEKRRKENERFLAMVYPVVNWFKQLPEWWRNRKIYRYFKCPSCKQRLRVPRGKGKICVHCPKCGNDFYKKS